MKVGVTKDIVKCLNSIPIEKLGLIFDSNLVSNNIFNKVLSDLHSSFPGMVVFENNFKGEPTYSFLEEAHLAFKDKRIDTIIAIGGGSTMDIGKGIALLLTNPSSALSLKGFPKNLNNPLPLVTVPTIFGSGSEVSYNAVFIDENEGKKLGINSKNNFPKLTIIDPLITMTAPIEFVISSAMDSLVHCVDSFGSLNHTRISRMYSINGFKSTFSALHSKDLSDPYNRLDLAIGSIYGTIALMNSGDGPTNGLAYFVGVNKKIPHGLAGAIFLLEVMKYNFSKGYLDYFLLNSNSKTTDKRELSIDLFDKMESIYQNYNIPRLTNYGYEEKSIEIIAKKASEALSGSFGGNPILFDETSAISVLRNLL